MMMRPRLGASKLLGREMVGLLQLMLDYWASTIPNSKSNKENSQKKGKGKVNQKS